jgi:hypothetical protein
VIVALIFIGTFRPASEFLAFVVGAIAEKADPERIPGQHPRQ